MVQEDTPFLKEVSTVTDDFGTTFGIVAVESIEDIVMGEAAFLFDRNTFWGPFSLQLVEVLLPDQPLELSHGAHSSSLQAPSPI